MTDQLHRQMLELLVKVMDLEGRTRLVNQVFSAWTANDKNEMLKVLDTLKLISRGTVRKIYFAQKPSSEEDSYNARVDKARVLWVVNC